MRVFVQLDQEDVVVSVVRSSTTDPCPDGLIEITDVQQAGLVSCGMKLTDDQDVDSVTPKQRKKKRSC